MEDHFKDAWLWLGKEAAEFGFRWLAVAAVMLGFGGFFGRRYRSMKKSIAELEDQARSPGIDTAVIFEGDVNIHNNDRQLREAIEAKTAQNLQETIRSLTQMPLGDGHTYARLPAGTNIVTMADGTMRLALPVRLSALGVSAVGSLSAAVLKTSPPEQDKQDDR